MSPLGTVSENHHQKPQNSAVIERGISEKIILREAPKIFDMSNILGEQKYLTAPSEIQPVKQIEEDGRQIFSGVISVPKNSGANALDPENIVRFLQAKKIFTGLKKGGRPQDATNAMTWEILLYYVRTGKWLQEELEGQKYTRQMVHHYLHHPKLLLAKQYVKAEKRHDDAECRTIRERALRNSIGTKINRAKTRARQAKKGAKVSRL